MGTELFRRPARRQPPPDPRGEIVLESPPELPETVSGGGGAQALMYLPMLAGAGSTAFLVTGSGGSPTTYLASGMMALSMGGMAIGSMGRGSGDKRRRLDGDRRDYQRYLEQIRRRVRSVSDQQRAAAEWHHPDPSALWCITSGTRLWERRAVDGDYLAVRVGRGSQRLAVQLVTPETKPIEDLEPISALALRQFVTTHSRVDSLPIAISALAFGRVSIAGDVSPMRSMARAVIGQLAAFHSPEDVMIAVCAAPERLPRWEWLKWLPHSLSADRSDAVGQERMVATNLLDLEELLGETLTGRPRFGIGTDLGTDGPHVVIVVDGGEIPQGAQLTTALVAGVTVLDLGGRIGGEFGAGVLRLELDGLNLRMVRRDANRIESRTDLGTADQLSLAEAETLARTMAPLRMSANTVEPTDALSADLSLPDLLRLGDPRQIDTELTWRPRALRDRLRVPIGVGASGQPVELDIKEAAQGGMGPHGLVIGATGSGKSELLRTLVLGLAITHSSEVLNFVLVDFKGGATFASLDVLPHTSAVITNLEDELILVDRMRDAIAGEMVRRQEALRAAGNYANLKDYERAREQGAPLEPMPSLFLVVDEFSELLSAKPDFIDLFVMIGRLGRSLGVHLLLASQRLEEGKLRGLDTHLSYRIGLRTFSAMESRVVLGVPDAYELPSAPGNGYLKEGTEALERFKAAYVSGAYAAARRGEGTGASAGSAQVLPYTTRRIDSPAAPRSLPALAEPEAFGPEVTLMQIIVERLAGRGAPARKVWLPPLDVPPSIDELLPPLEVTELGLRPTDWDPAPSLAAPVGLVDRPFDQRRDPHWIDLSSSHFVVVGRPQSGKSTLLRSLIVSMALTNTPAQAQFYCLDFGGGTLTGLTDLPHVGSVATRLEQERLRRTIAELNGLLAAREEMFTRLRIDSMSTYRRMLAQGSAPSDGYGDVFLVVDGWGTVRTDHEDLEAAITQIAARGLGFGIHVVLSVQRWMEVRPALRDLISNRLELRLGDPTESDVDRRLAINVPEAAPGRGVVPAKYHFLSALPRIDGKGSTEDLAEGVDGAVARISAAWPGPGARPVRLLPRRLPFGDLPTLEPDRRGLIPIGLEEDSLSLVSLDLDAEPHFICIGDVESGKSNLLRVIARSVTGKWSPDQAKIITLDYRRGQLGAITTAHQIGYVMNSVAAPDTVRNIVEALRQRLSGITVDPASGQVPKWAGPHLFLLIDDYELVTGSQGNPLPQLVEFLPQARDIGLHVIVTRSSGGVGQGMYEPFMRTLREMGTPGLLLSGPKDEGSVLGSTKMELLPTGRGRFVHRRIGSVLVQTPLAD